MKIFRKMIIIDLIMMILTIIVWTIPSLESVGNYAFIITGVGMFANFYITSRIKREEIKKYHYSICENKKMANFYFKWSIVTSYIALIASIIMAIVFIKLML